MATYGTHPLDGPFAWQELHDKARSTRIALADGTFVTVTEVEIQNATDDSGFSDKDLDAESLTADPNIRNAVMKMANLIYAAQAKRMAHGAFGYRRALSALHESKEEVDPVFERLGFIREGADALTEPKSGFVFGTELETCAGDCESHVVYGYPSAKGDQYDEYGDEEPLTAFLKNHNFPVEKYWRYAPISPSGMVPVKLGMQCAEGTTYPELAWKNCGT